MRLEAVAPENDRQMANDELSGNNVDSPISVSRIRTIQKRKI